MKRQEKPEGFPGQRLVVIPRSVVSKALHEPLLAQLLPTDAGFYPKAQGHACSRDNGCPESVFIYCAGGKGWCEMTGRRHEVMNEVGKEGVIEDIAGWISAHR